MTYKGAICEVKMLFQNPMMPDIFKPSLNKIAETLEMEKEIQPCEDCISRQAVIDVFGDVHPMDYNAMAYLKQIKSLPPIQPIRPKGKWMNVLEDIYHCNLCKKSHCFKTNFCPNCGADMRGEEI